jgi:Dr1-associated corepressor
MPRTRAKRPADDEDDEFNPNIAQARPPLAPTMRKTPTTQTMHSGEDLALTIDVKTKFPVARIKRIMQADEDVGKVAQATPTAVGKSSLVDV